MSLKEIQDRYRLGYVIPDLGTIHYERLTQAVKDIHQLLRLIDAYQKRSEGPLVGDAACCSKCGYAGHIEDNENDYNHLCGHAPEPHWSI